MYDYIRGSIAEINPAYVVIDACGIGYFINISLQTYTKISSHKEATLYVQQKISDTAHVLFGFHDRGERELFRLLTSVPGVGPSTARIMLSSLSIGELTGAIASGNLAVLKGVKGIGAKTAERIVVDLKSKVMTAASGAEMYQISQDAGVVAEAVAALIALGFPKAPTDKAVDAAYRHNPAAAVEQLIKDALQRL